MADQTTTTFNNSFATELGTQSWSLFGVGALIYCLRMFTRLRYNGWRRLELDDLFATIAFVLYVGLIVCLNVIADGGGSNLYPPGQDATFTPEDIKERIYGSKIVIVSEQCMLNVIYSLKCTVLLFYRRLTNGVAKQRMVNYVAIAVAIGWLSTEITFFTACRPFHGYWAVPPPNPQCTTLQHYAIVQACFNIPTDLAMLSISIPLVLRLQVPLKQKMLMGLLFSMGIFVVLAAILTKVYNLSDVYSTSYMLWYTREASVATYVANLPAVWPLLRHVFPCLRGASQMKSSGNAQYQYRYGQGFSGHGGSRANRTGNNTMVDTIDMDTQALRLEEYSGKDAENSINITTTVEVTKEREHV